MQPSLTLYHKGKYVLFMQDSRKAVGHIRRREKNKRVQKMLDMSGMYRSQNITIVTFWVEQRKINLKSDWDYSGESLLKV